MGKLNKPVSSSYRSWMDSYLKGQITKLQKEVVAEGKVKDFYKQKGKN
jgi:hypothetical protein